MGFQKLNLTKLERQIVREEAKKKNWDLKFFRPFEQTTGDITTEVLLNIASAMIIGVVCMLSIGVPASTHGAMGAWIGTICTVVTLLASYSAFYWLYWGGCAIQLRYTFYTTKDIRADGTHVVHGFTIPFNIHTQWERLEGCTRIPDELRAAIAAECGQLSAKLHSLHDASDFTPDEFKVTQRVLSEQFAELKSAVDNAVAYHENGEHLDGRVAAQRAAHESQAYLEYKKSGGKTPLGAIADSFSECNDRLIKTAKSVKSFE